MVMISEATNHEACKAAGIITTPPHPHTPFLFVFCQHAQHPHTPALPFFCFCVSLSSTSHTSRWQPTILTPLSRSLPPSLPPPHTLATTTRPRIGKCHHVWENLVNSMAHDPSHRANAFIVALGADHLYLSPDIVGMYVGG